jgi:hypothetical protein
MQIQDTVLHWLPEEENPSVHYRTPTELLDVDPANGPHCMPA